MAYFLDLVKCGNPAVTDSLFGKKRYHSATLIPQIIKEGVRYCKWCGVKELKSKMQQYCSEWCKSSCYMMLAPQSRFGCAYLLYCRQNNKCNICTYSWGAIIKGLREISLYSIARVIPGTNWKGIKGCQVDHKIPVVDGGLTFGFENMQAICIDCHKEKTKMENKLRNH